MGISSEEFHQLNLEFDEIRDGFRSLRRPFQTISQIVHGMEKNFGQAEFFVRQIEKEISEKDREHSSYFADAMFKMARQKLKLLAGEISQEEQLDFKLKSLRNRLFIKTIELDKKLNAMEGYYTAEVEPVIE